MSIKACDRQANIFLEKLHVHAVLGAVKNGSTDVIVLQSWLTL